MFMIYFDAKMATLSKIDRHQKILEVLSVEKHARLPDLESSIQASRITIQRDLAELEERGLIRRFHGGAMLADHDLAPEAHARRMAVNRDQKRRLCAAAATHVKGNSFLALDASSTLYYLSETVIPEDVTIVTSGVDTFVGLTSRVHSGVQAILTGGRFQPESHTLVGPDAIRTIDSYHYEAFLFSAYSIIPGAGVFEYNEDNAAVKRAFAAQSERRILVFDQTKYEHRGGVKICDLSDIDLLITDGEPPMELAETFGGTLAVI